MASDVDTAMDDVTGKLEEIIAVVEGARAMPMSASCVVNRGELLGLLADLRSLLPTEFRQAQYVLRDREEVVDEGRREAERIIEEARHERQRMIGDTDIVREAMAESDRLLGEATARAEEMRRGVDDYVDSKLANFEVVLTKTLGAVERGREKLRGRVSEDAFAEPDEAPLPGLPS